jgi:hypothetical protein
MRRGRAERWCTSRATGPRCRPISSNGALTFEVIADPAPVTIGAIATDLGVAAEAAGQALGGFSAYGDSVRGVLETLAEVEGAWFAADGDAIVMQTGPGVTTMIADTGTTADGRGERRIGSLAPAESAPRALVLAHYDPARDFQAGVQRAIRPGAGGREDKVELPAAIDAGHARAIAEGMLARANLRRERRTVTLAAASGLPLQPGMRVTIAGEVGSWRITRWALEQMVVKLELERIARAPMLSPTTSGRASLAPDLIHGPTVMHAFELPPLDAAVLTAPRLLVAAGGGPGWRQAALLLSMDGGGSWTPAGGTAMPATLGTVVLPPASGTALLADLAGMIEVELTHAGMTLADAGRAALDAGANRALVGDEIIQFGRATPIAPRRWRLTNLLRGRRGTEPAMAEHHAGERFVLLEPETLTEFNLPVGTLGQAVRVLASSVGDTDGAVEASAQIDGASLRPPAPVALRWSANGDGGATLRWTRRSRSGWHWLDGSDVPLAEESERYRIEIGDRVEIVTTPVAVITAAERTDGPVPVRIRQLGTMAESPATSIVVPAA